MAFLTLNGKRFGDAWSVGYPNPKWYCSSWLNIWGSGRETVLPYYENPRDSDVGHETAAIDIVQGMAVTL